MSDSSANKAAAASLAFELLKAGIPALIEAIEAALAESGKDDAEDLRGRPMSVSVSFSGGEGEAIVAQRNVEAKLPDDFEF